MERVGLIVHPSREIDRTLGSLRSWAHSQDADVVQLAVPGQAREVAPFGNVQECDFVVALGGDGTALAALRTAGAAGKPMLGVGCGSLGALTSVSADRLPTALDRMVAGDFKARKLPALELEGIEPAPTCALNDYVFVRAGAGQMSLSIWVDDELYVRFSGDGLIVATALGSSAYTLAAGGPLLAVGALGTVVTPLAPHGGSCPPMVIGADARLDVLVEPGHGGARLEADGQPAGDFERLIARRVTIRARPDHATIALLDDEEPMLSGLRRRKIVMDSPRLLARDARLASDSATVSNQ